MEIPELNFPATLLVTEQTIDISGFSQRQKSFYLGLFWELVAFYNFRSQPRVVIGIVGPTGSGKSVVAILFKELAKQARLNFAFDCITIDAYHYPNRFLNSRFSGGEPLKKVKGRFDTYDVKALVSDLHAFAAGEKAAFPTYSRKLHDPVADGVRIEEKKALLIVEGLWLLYDQAGWEAIGPLLDYSLFIESAKERTREPVIRRHMNGGRSLEDAARHYELVDGRNSDLVLATKHRADRVIPPYYLV